MKSLPEAAARVATLEAEASGLAEVVAARRPPTKQLQSALSKKDAADRKLTQAQAAVAAARAALREAEQAEGAAKAEADAAEQHVWAVRSSTREAVTEATTQDVDGPAGASGVAAVYQLLLELNTQAGIAAAEALRVALGGRGMTYPVTPERKPAEREHGAPAAAAAPDAAEGRAGRAEEIEPDRTERHRTASRSPRRAP